MRLLLVLLVCVYACSNDEPARVRVGAATVLRHAMPELAAAFRAQSGTQVDVVYGASDSLLARTGIDVLVLADDRLAANPVPIATTTMVLVGPEGSAYRFANLGDAVIAIGDPKTVPAGRYARTYLEQLGVWNAAAPRLVYGGDVLGVLALAQRGTSHVAIVYATDAPDAAPLVVLDRAANGPVVRIAASSPRETKTSAPFISFLASPAAQRVLERHGFSRP